MKPLSRIRELIPNQGSVAVGTAQVLVLPQVPIGMRRVSYAITNTSASSQVVSLGEGIDAIAGNGYVLYATGTLCEAQIGDSFPPFQGQINAIASAASGTIAYREWLIQEF